MLSQAIGDVLPAAVGVALSPVPIIAVVLVLGTPKARSNGPAFALGWIAGLTVVSAVVLVVASGSDDPGSAAADGVSWGTLVLGVLLLVLAARKWRNRPKDGEEPELPAWVETVDSFTPGKSLVTGLALSAANPKNLALTLAAAASVAQSGADAADDVVAVAVFVVIGSLTVAGPVLFALVAPERAAAPLASVKQFMSAHSAVIMMVILVVLGAKLVGDSLGGVFG